MNEIQRLIHEMCPDGVPMVALGDLFDQKNGYTPSKNEPSYWEKGNLPWFRMEDIRENGRILNDSILHITPAGLKKSGLFPANSIIVATSATIGEHALITVDFLCNQRFTCLVPKAQYKDRVDMKFYFYIMFEVDEWCKNHVNQGGFASVDMSGFSSIQIPLPPLPIQQRIVEILDKFTSLVSSLDSEIALRQKQYEYYRNKLLSFEEGEEGVEWKKLGEVGRMIRGNGLQKSDFRDSGFPCIHYGQIHTYYGTSASITKSFCDVEFAKKLKKAHTGDLLIATTSEDVDACCKAVAWLGNEDVAYSGDSYCFTHNQNLKYMSYLFQTELFAKQKRKVATGAKVVRVSGESMEKFIFPFPSLDHQLSIVRTLDAFESLLTNLKKERELRQKQYEYYREKLLTFA